MSVVEKRSPGRPRGEQVENTARRRRQFIEAAIDSIVERGMSSTTLATVAAGAGLSQGAAVFYFKSKDNLLLETLKYHYAEYEAVWSAALEGDFEDPVDAVFALVMAELDPRLCTTRNLALWNSFWGEVSARPRFAEICDRHDRKRYDRLVALCESAEWSLIGYPWTAGAVADTLDSMTDGMWIRMHITPGHINLANGRMQLARFLATVFPSHARRVMDRAAAISD
jgi:TetR/AcrR family transcriptional repressor of bet genes